MGATVPEKVAETDLSRRLQQHLKLKHRGKVRDTYELPGHPDKLLVVATDRISIRDFVLGVLIPFKGEVLVALTVFWLKGPLSQFTHHLVAFGRRIDDYLPEELHGDSELIRRSLIIDRHDMFLVECIARGYLTGSGLKSYKKSGQVCGIELPPGLHDGSKLDEPIFTPTTKAEVGHDEDINSEWVRSQYGSWPQNLTLSLYKAAAEYAAGCGIILADTKFEFGANHVLCDEVLTPDSSRFWDSVEYEEAQKENKSPTGYDKEPVRQAGDQAIIDGKVVNIGGLKPENPDDVELAARWEIPKEVIEQTTERYRTIAARLMGMHLEEFQAAYMGI